MRRFLLLLCALLLCFGAYAASIEGMTVLGEVKADGAKPYAIVLLYDTELDTVTAEDYEVWNYWMDQQSRLELGSVPEVTRVYVNNEPKVSREAGSGPGRFVIIELSTDYQAVQSVEYRQSMASSVTAGGVTLSNFDEVVSSWGGRTMRQLIAREGTYSIDCIDRYKIDVFHAEDCFEEATGEYVPVDLDYALFVPEDYDERKEYMLVLHIEDAGALGTDARLVLTEARTPMRLSSEEMQEIARSQGYGGIIVVCPQISMPLRSTRDNYTVSAAVQATWKLLDSITEEYSIDKDRIYGTGQSMGGMQVLAMAAQRDNYFAAILSVGCQWGNNYNKEDPYNGDVYYQTPVDDVYVLSTDADGNPADWRNWYYMISDDNILSVNCVGDSFSSTVWSELAFLYKDTSGAVIPKTRFNPLTTDIAEQDRLADELLSSDNSTGIYWLAFEGGNHMATWVYSGRLTSIYRWLLTQSRVSEMEREKLEALQNPFKMADQQLRTEDRKITESSYFVTLEPGSGTSGYNSGLYSINGGEPVRMPGWNE